MKNNDDEAAGRTNDAGYSFAAYGQALWNKKSGTCDKYFYTGRCHRGDNCPYEHDQKLPYEMRKGSKKGKGRSRSSERGKGGKGKGKDDRYRSDSYTRYKGKDDKGKGGKGKYDYKGKGKDKGKGDKGKGGKGKDGKRSFSNGKGKSKGKDDKGKGGKSKGKGKQDGYYRSSSQQRSQPTTGWSPSGKADRPPCRFYYEGKCQGGKHCDFWHPGLCRAYQQGNCPHGRNCVYLHKSGKGDYRRGRAGTPRGYARAAHQDDDQWYGDEWQEEADDQGWQDDQWHEDEWQEEAYAYPAADASEGTAWTKETASQPQQINFAHTFTLCDKTTGKTAQIEQEKGPE